MRLRLFGNWGTLFGVRGGDAMDIRVVRPTHQNMYHQNKSNLSKINGGLEKALFQKKMLQRGLNFKL